MLSPLGFGSRFHFWHSIWMVLRNNVHNGLSSFTFFFFFFLNHHFPLCFVLICSDGTWINMMMRTKHLASTRTAHTFIISLYTIYIKSRQLNTMNGISRWWDSGENFAHPHYKTKNVSSWEDSPQKTTATTTTTTIVIIIFFGFFRPNSKYNKKNVMIRIKR